MSAHTAPARIEVVAAERDEALERVGVRVEHRGVGGQHVGEAVRSAAAAATPVRRAR